MPAWSKRCKKVQISKGNFTKGSHADNHLINCFHVYTFRRLLQKADNCVPNSFWYTVAFQYKQFCRRASVLSHEPTSCRPQVCIWYCPQDRALILWSTEAIRSTFLTQRAMKAKYLDFFPSQSHIRHFKTELNSIKCEWDLAECILWNVITLLRPVCQDKVSNIKPRCFKGKWNYLIAKGM